MESVFEIIAEPNRRAILSLLVSSQQSVGEIGRQLRMPQPTVSKHLRVLREAGSGPLTWMLSNATSTTWINRHQRKGRQGEDDAAQTANVTKEKRNENQI